MTARRGTVVEGWQPHIELPALEKWFSYCHCYGELRMRETILRPLCDPLTGLNTVMVHWRNSVLECSRAQNMHYMMPRGSSRHLTLVRHCESLYNQPIARLYGNIRRMAP